MNPVLRGALAGTVATAPMTATMLALHRQLPRQEQYALPPREITMRITRAASMHDEIDTEAERTTATLVSHFAYGAACGALYAPVAHKLPGGPVGGGVLFALGVWSGSYLGWLPVLGIRRMATEHPPRREGLMIAAHVVFGAALGWLNERLAERD